MPKSTDETNGLVSPIGERMYEDVLRKCVFDSKHPPPLEGVRAFTINHLFAKIWSRSSDEMIGEGISLRERRLITIALLAAQGRADQLKDHVVGARRSGMKKAELFEVMIQVAHYAGWAAGSSGQSTVLKVFKARKSGRPECAIKPRRRARTR